MGFSVDAWREAFERMPPRESQVLQRLMLDDRSDAEVQAAYGMSPESFSVTLLRSLRSLDAALHQVHPSLQSDSVEKDEVQTLMQARSAGTGHPLAALMADVATVKTEVKTALREAAVQAEKSPARKRENQIRSVLFWVLVVVSAYLYWQHEAPELSLGAFLKSVPSRIFSTAPTK